jgi:hypothetical protein
MCPPAVVEQPMKDVLGDHRGVAFWKTAQEPER